MTQKVSDLILNLKADTKFIIQDLYKEEGKAIIGIVNSTDNLSLLVATGGASRMVKLIPYDLSKNKLIELILSRLLKESLNYSDN